MTMNSCPCSTKMAWAVARRFARIPDSVSDQDVVDGKAGITPAQIQIIVEAIVMIIQSIMTNCVPNNRVEGLGRIRSFLANTKPLQHVGDRVMLTRVVKQNLDLYGVPQEKGTVMAMRQALMQEAEAITDEQFGQLQDEIVYLPI